MHQYLLRHSEAPEKQRVIKLVSDNEPTESEGIMYSAAQRLIDEGMEKGIQKGMEKGIQKGMEKGIQKGRLEGQVALLRRQLQLKFPRAPKSAFSRLDGAGASELEAWSERIVTATTLEEVFAP